MDFGNRFHFFLVVVVVVVFFQLTFIDFIFLFKKLRNKGM